MKALFGKDEKHKNLDYICGFVFRACSFLDNTKKAALVATNSIAQGTHVPVLWPVIYRLGCQIEFAYETFKWANNAHHNAGVSCTIVGFTKDDARAKYIYSQSSKRQVSNINPYLVEGSNIIIESRSRNDNNLSPMITGNAAYDGGHLFVSVEEARVLVARTPKAKVLLRRVSGTSEFIDGVTRYCLWINDRDFPLAQGIPEIASRN
jgi:hypothetical protein